MLKNICLAQSSEELKFILEHSKSDLICVPLNLDSQLYCMKNKLNYIDPINFVGKEFHKKALELSKELIDKLHFGDITFESIKLEYKAIIRFRFNCIVYLIELINKINQQITINEIFISGWGGISKREYFSEVNYFLSDLAINLFKNIKVRKILKVKNKKKNAFFYNEYFTTRRISNKKKGILLNNLGYNFKRIWSVARKNQFQVYCFSFKKINLIKKIIFKLLNIDIIEFKNTKINSEKNFSIPEIEFFYDNIDLSYLLNKRKEEMKSYLFELTNKANAISKFMKKNSFSLVAINLVRGLDGCLTESIKDEKIPTICISHGTIAKSFNAYDDIYKKIIAEAVFSGHNKYFAIQTKITDDALKTHKLNGKSLTTGNIIFSETKRKKKCEYVLFATTLKDFDGYQFLGVEMYYEFLKNLDLFSKITEKYNLKFIVNIHNTQKHCKNLLSQLYPKLKFTTSKIEKVLEKSFVTISFSSTAIEDSLCSRVPVILFDQWRRYQHCEAELDSKTKNCGIYYLTNEKDLIECINSFNQSSNDIDFNRFIFNHGFRNNIRENVFKLVN